MRMKALEAIAFFFHAAKATIVGVFVAATGSVLDYVEDFRDDRSQK